MMLNTHYYATTRLEMHKFIPEKYSRVLEIGCGCGNFSNNLRHIECEIWGIEPNKDAAKEAATKFDRVLIGNFSDLLDSIPDNYFDLVVCNDVIEHMIDHDKFFEEIKPKITQTGSFVGSIPNILYISSFYKIVIKRDWPYANEGILDRTHLRFFTYKSLKNCLLSHKLTPEH